MHVFKRISFPFALHKRPCLRPDSISHDHFVEGRYGCIIHKAPTQGMSVFEPTTYLQGACVDNFPVLKHGQKDISRVRVRVDERSPPVRKNLPNLYVECTVFIPFLPSLMSTSPIHAVTEAI